MFKRIQLTPLAILFFASILIAAEASLPLFTLQEESTLGGSTVSEWRIIGEDSALLTGPNGRAIYRLSDGELIYGDLGSGEYAGIQDYSPEQELVIIQKTSRHVILKDVKTNEIVSEYQSEDFIWPFYGISLFYDQGEVWRVQNESGVAYFNIQTGAAVSHRPQQDQINDNFPFFTSYDGNVSISFGELYPTDYPGETTSYKSIHIKNNQTDEELLNHTNSTSRRGQVTIHKNFIGAIARSTLGDIFYLINRQNGEVTKIPLLLNNLSSVNDIAINPSADSFALKESGETRLFRSSDGALLSTLSEALLLNNIDSDITSISFLKVSGNFITIHSDGKIHEWNALTGDYIGVKADTEYQSIFLISDNDEYGLGTKANDYTIYLFDLDNPSDEKAILDREINNNHRSNFSYDFSPDSSRLCLLDERGQWLAYDTSTKLPTARSPQPQGHIQFMAPIAETNQVIIQANQSGFEIYDLESQKKEFDLYSLIPKNLSNHVFTSNTGVFAGTYFDEELHLLVYDLKTQSTVLDTAEIAEPDLDRPEITEDPRRESPPNLLEIRISDTGKYVWTTWSKQVLWNNTNRAELIYTRVIDTESGETALYFSTVDERYYTVSGTKSTTFPNFLR